MKDLYTVLTTPLVVSEAMLCQCRDAEHKLQETFQSS
jgi:hypothetical protein